jgi:hypothetical protein
MIQRTAILIALQLVTSFAFVEAWAQSPIRVMVAEGDTISKDEANAVLGNIAEEYKQLEGRIRTTTQNSDPLSILVGQLVGQAMTRVVVLKPAAGVRLIGIVGQMDGPEGPSLVLYDITGWVEKGVLWIPFRHSLQLMCCPMLR